MGTETSSLRVAATWLRRQVAAKIHVAHGKTAGAVEFEVFVKRHDARSAFKEAVEDARHESGHGGHTGTIAEKHDFKLRSSTPMSMEEATQFASKDIGHADKWGPAFAVPVTESKVKKETAVTLKVSARSEDEAIAAAKAQTAKPGVETYVKRSSVKLLKGGSRPKITKIKGTEVSYRIQAPGKAMEYAAYKDRTTALEALKKQITSKARKGDVFQLWKIQETDRVVVTEESSALPTWEVTVEVREIQKGPVLGYLFYGLASS